MYYIPSKEPEKLESKLVFGSSLRHKGLEFVSYGKANFFSSILSISELGSRCQFVK